jgi:hypothetical protein
VSGARWGLPSAAWRIAAPAGVVAGIVYLLSPLTIWFAVAMVLLVRWAVKDLAEGDRRWVVGLLLIAITLRVLAVAGLFLWTDHTRIPFGVFFGDEEYYLRRSIWMRNLAVGLPLHSADLIYMFDETGRTSHLYVLAFVQALVGPSPYGVHLLGATFFLTGSVVLYRLAWSSLGRMPALVSLVLLLWLPSLFAWSISALKEPLFFMLTAWSVTLAVGVARGRGWRRVEMVVAIAIVAAAVESVRQAGAVLTAAGVAGGLALAGLIARPRLLIATAVAVPILVGATLNRPERQLKAYTSLQGVARQHWGHVATPGYVYTLLDERFYADRSSISDLGFSESARYVVRAFVRYVTVPLPWEARSASALAYMPEQIVWYAVVALLPFGIVFALRRDPVVACVLLATASIAIISVALTSGNVGTLVRHRGLAMPYLICLSAVGLCELLSRAVAARARPVS